MDFYSNLDEFWRKFSVSEGVFIPKLVKKLEKPQFGPYATYTFHKTDILTY